MNFNLTMCKVRQVLEKASYTPEHQIIPQETLFFEVVELNSKLVSIDHILNLIEKFSVKKSPLEHQGKIFNLKKEVYQRENIEEVFLTSFSYEVAKS